MAQEAGVRQRSKAPTGTQLGARLAVAQQLRMRQQCCIGWCTKKVQRVSHLPVAQSTDGAPRLFSYPWRTYFRRATPKRAQAGRPGTSLAVAHGPNSCATAKLLPMAQCNVVRHVYLAMAHAFCCAPRLLGLPISLFLVVDCGLGHTGGGCCIFSGFTLGSLYRSCRHW